MGTSQNHTTYLFFLFATVLAFLTISINLTRIVLFSGKTKSYNDPVVAEKVVRGTITDRSGQIIAIETPTSSLYFHLSLINDLPHVASVVSPLIGMSAEEVTEQAGKYTTYALIKEGLDDDTVSSIKNVLDKEGLARCVSIERKQGRSYPATFHASQTIGSVNSEGKGLEGLEYSLDEELSPKPEIGRKVTYGEDVALTLDIDVQYLLDVEMQKIADVHKPDYAVGVVMDAKSGDILAISSYPWYDSSTIAISTDSQRLNHAVNYLFEPGSVFKVFSLAAVMDAGQADLTTPFFCDGNFSFDGTTISCHERHGSVTPKEMVAKSCNGAISSWALQTDKKRFHDALSSYGFNRSWDIGLPSKSKARIKAPSLWSQRSEATISFGQELSVTALHLATAATALANEGTLLTPHLILRKSQGNALGETGKTLWERKTEPVGQVMGKDTARAILDDMKAATEKGGTAIKCAVEGIDVSAKTGTAQILNKETNSYQDGTVLASTLALVPTESPRYIIYIAAGNPKGDTIWGANIASPAVGEVIKGLVSQGKLTNPLSPRL